MWAGCAPRTIPIMREVDLNLFLMRSDFVLKENRKVDVIFRCKMITKVVDRYA